MALIKEAKEKMPVSELPEELKQYFKTREELKGDKSVVNIDP